MTGSTLVQLAPTSRDDVIRADIARGVPVDALSQEWGLSPVDIARIGAGIPVLPAAPEPEPEQALIVRTGSGRIINPYDESLPDPDERRDPRAAEYHRERLTESTRYSYRRFIAMYLDYCALTGRREVPGNRFTIEGFSIWLAERPVTKGKNKGKIGMAPSSISSALSAVRALHVACGENPPDRDLARGIIERHEKRRAKDRTIHDGVGSPAVDLPTFADLVAACPPETNAGLRDRAMLTLGLNIMARRSELCILDLDDVKVRRDGWLEVYIHETKSGKPRTAIVPPWDDPELCPKRAWLAYKKRIVSLGITEGSAFRGVDRWDNVQGAGPWAGRAQLGSRLDGSTLEHIVARAAIRAAVDDAEKLSPHGVLRRTGATVAYANGADILAICRQGGWDERSPVVFRYIDTVDMKERNPMLLVGQSMRV